MADPVPIVSVIVAVGGGAVGYLGYRRSTRLDRIEANAVTDRDRADSLKADNDRRTVGIAELEAAVKAQGTVIDRQTRVIDDMGQQVAHLEAEVEKCHQREHANDLRIAGLEAAIK